MRWSYGPKKDHSQCATGSRKSPECTAGGWTLCGSNTYPAGAFPGCVNDFGLYDMVLVKDNHLAAFGGLSGFADRIRQLRQEQPNIRIEVEADDLEQVRAFVEVDGINVILLDNMTPAQIREAVALKRDNIKFEASGGITLKNVKRVAATGVDYISIGALTNSARAIDLALEMTHVPG